MPILQALCPTGDRTPAQWAESTKSGLNCRKPSIWRWVAGKVTRLTGLSDDTGTVLLVPDVTAASAAKEKTLVVWGLGTAVTSLPARIDLSIQHRFDIVLVDVDNRSISLLNRQLKLSFRHRIDTNLSICGTYRRRFDILYRRICRYRIDIASTTHFWLGKVALMRTAFTALWPASHTRTTAIKIWKDWTKQMAAKVWKPAMMLTMPWYVLSSVCSITYTMMPNRVAGMVTQCSARHRSCTQARRNSRTLAAGRAPADSSCWQPGRYAGIQRPRELRGNNALLLSPHATHLTVAAECTSQNGGLAAIAIVPLSQFSRYRPPSIDAVV